MKSTFSSLQELKHVRDELAKSAHEREHKRLQALRQAILREQEANAFKLAVADVEQIDSSGRADLALPAALPSPHQRIQDELNVLHESVSDEFSLDTLLQTDETLSFSRPGVSPDVLKKLRKRHWTIQAQIDLHGLRTDQARQAVGDFLRECGKHGLRCVRIIHGKGLGSVDKAPVLKSKVRSWLVQRDQVLAFVTAPPNDGGAGALIVLLAGTANKTSVNAGS